MATQLFFRNAVSDYATGNKDTNLAGTAIGWHSRLLSLTRGSSAQANSVVTVTGPTNGLELGSAGVPYAWYSPPLSCSPPCC